ncbi:MAG: efflux RND transporter periplasmic adaptor subunit [Rhodospirillaceae bacterium]
MDMHASEIQTVSARRPPPSRLRRAVWFLLMAVLLVGLGAGLYGFDRFRARMIAQYFAGNVPPPATVTAATAVAEPVPRFLEAIGTVAAVHQVIIAPEVAGRVTVILFESGAEVKAGQALLQLNDAPDRADLAAFRAREQFAALQLERSQALAGKNFASRQTVDQSRSELDIARANIAKTEAEIARKLVRAPFTGRLGVRQAEVGQILNPGTPIVSLTDLDTLYINFTLPEQARATLATGQKVELRVGAWPDRSFAAIVTTLEPQIDPITRSIKAQAALTNPERLLQPGMFAGVRVVLPSRGDVVTVPETAVDYSAYGESVYIIRESTGADGKPQLIAAQTFVKTGGRHDGKVVIVDGVAAGDRVVSAGQLKLHNGAAISISGDPGLIKPAQPPVN